MNARLAAPIFVAVAAASVTAAAPPGDAVEDTTVVWERADAQPSPQSAPAAWTPQRMAAAPPLDIVIDDAGTLTPTAAPATIAQRVPRPYLNGAKRQTGVAFFRFPGQGDARCSATAVDSANGAVVWTAAHCVYNPANGKFMKNWVFVPGYASSATDPTPFGKWNADALGVTGQWANTGNPHFDLGAVVVLPKGGDTLADRVGGRELQFNYATNPPLTVQAVGYPAVSPFEGNRQYRCTGTLKVGDPLLGTGGPDPVHLRCDMTGGSSGGGWRIKGGVNDGDVISVVSYGYSTKPKQRYGPYQGASAENLFTCAQQDYAGC